MVSRRTTLIGFGGLLVGGGTLLSTGAFTSISAERSVSMSTAGDASAFLSLEVLDGEVVDETDGTIEFDILADGATVFQDLVDVRNRGTQTVTSLRFEFVVEGANQPDGAVENALRIVSGEATIDAVDEKNLLAESDAGDADDDELDPGEAIPFGIEVDLTGGSIDRIDGEPDITLRIIADTGDVGNGGGGDDGDSDDGGDDGPPAAPRFVFASGPNADPPWDMSFDVENRGPTTTIEGFRVDIVGSQGNPPTQFEEYEIETDTDQEREGENESGFPVNAAVSHDPYTLTSNGTVSYTLTEFDSNTQSLLSNSPQAFEFYVVTDDSGQNVFEVVEPSSL